MKLLLLGVAVLATACGATDPAPQDLAAPATPHPPHPVQAPSVPNCDLYIREVEADRSLASYPFIRPQHVASIEAVHESPTSANPSLAFHLTDIGRQRLLEHSESHEGREIAIFCGRREVLRPMITGPFPGPIFIEISAIEHASTTGVDRAW